MPGSRVLVGRSQATDALGLPGADEIRVSRLPESASSGRTMHRPAGLALRHGNRPSQASSTCRNVTRNEPAMKITDVTRQRWLRTA